MRTAEKFVKRGEAKIHMVWEDWFWDSLKVKGRLEEASGRRIGEEAFARVARARIGDGASAVSNRLYLVERRG